MENDEEYIKRVAKVKRSLPIVTPDQFEALEMYREHYEVLSPLLTIASEVLSEALERGYQTGG